MVWFFLRDMKDERGIGNKNDDCFVHNVTYVLFVPYVIYTQATLKFMELNTQSQQCEAVVQGRSLPPIPASV
ncbi:MAG: hypothetical protein LBJ00_11210 [Planctomycetaceae bacterium]|jgi:hypothetical protein|nr:hypothetical protein [Planctomycetaceae bacterium]